MYVGYAAFMLCRNTLGAASPMMMEDAALAMGKPEYGRLLSWASAGAIIGKLVTGIGADILGGRALEFCQFADSNIDASSRRDRFDILDGL